MTAVSVPKEMLPAKIERCFQNAQVIVPTDNVVCGPFAGLYVGGAGDVNVIMRNGDGNGGTAPVLFKAVPAGTILPIAIQAVQANLTTATLMIGLG